MYVSGNMVGLENSQRGKKQLDFIDNNDTVLLYFYHKAITGFLF